MSIKFFETRNGRIAEILKTISYQKVVEYDHEGSGLWMEYGLPEYTYYCKDVKTGNEFQFTTLERITDKIDEYEYSEDINYKNLVW